MYSVPAARKLLVFISRSDSDSKYALLCRELASLISHAMPAPPLGTALVRFDRDWRPHLLSAVDVPSWMIEKQQGIRLPGINVAPYELMFSPVLKHSAFPARLTSVDPLESSS